jgi:hypothetical protein
MSDTSDAASHDDREARFLLSTQGIRQRAEEVYASVLRGRSSHWVLDEGRLSDVVDRVVRTTAATYPSFRAIPTHSRWRHFGAGGLDRVSALAALLRVADVDERLAAQIDLVVTSVLLDAGAGDSWRYRAATGETYTRSEGLAVASYDLFLSGCFAAHPDREPLRADGAALRRVDASSLALAFQVNGENPLVGLEGRAALLRRLGSVVDGHPEYFARPDRPGDPPRLGNLALYLQRTARGGELSASAVLSAILEVFGAIWPAREVCAGRPLGDVWKHSQFGRIPFHKLSQWLAYSFLEPLEWAGLRITRVDDLTGLAEYRNGGLFVDGGVLCPLAPERLLEAHDVDSDLVIEWRALTIALLDRTAEAMRRRLDLSADELPLARVLEGGTWQAGRALAAERRPSGGPPIRVRSDGTVF